MKNKLVAICVVIVIAMSTSFAYADMSGTAVVEDDTSKYVDAIYAFSQMTISGNSATCTTKVRTKDASTVNKMVVAVYYYKSDGTSLGSNTVTVTSTGHLFAGSTSRTLYSHGTYYAEARVKLYHNSQLIESFVLVTNNATY